MFRLIRLFLLIGLAFVAGVIYARQSTVDACAAAGGDMVDGLCYGATR